MNTEKLIIDKNWLMQMINLGEALFNDKSEKYMFEKGILEGYKRVFEQTENFNNYIEDAFDTGADLAFGCYNSEESLFQERRTQYLKQYETTDI